MAASANMTCILKTLVSYRGDFKSRHAHYECQKAGTQGSRQWDNKANQCGVNPACQVCYQPYCKGMAPVKEQKQTRQHSWRRWCVEVQAQGPMESGMLPAGPQQGQHMTLLAEEADGKGNQLIQLLVVRDTRAWPRRKQDWSREHLPPTGKQAPQQGSLERTSNSIR